MQRVLRSTLVTLLLAAALMAVAPPLAAQDVSGHWTMATTASLPVAMEPAGLAAAVEPCIFDGDCEMQQDGGEVTGTVDLALISGPEGCPAEMTGTIDGSFDGPDIYGTLTSPVYGEASFQASPTASFEGNFDVTEGDYTGTTGSFIAERQSVLEIPTLTALGLSVLMLALLAGGAWMLRSARHPA